MEPNGLLDAYISPWNLIANNAGIFIPTVFSIIGGLVALRLSRPKAYENIRHIILFPVLLFVAIFQSLGLVVYAISRQSALIKYATLSDNEQVLAPSSSLIDVLYSLELFVFLFATIFAVWVLFKAIDIIFHESD